jgi:hypothetical protein
MVKRYFTDSPEECTSDEYTPPQCNLLHMVNIFFLICPSSSPFSVGKPFLEPNSMSMTSTDLKDPVVGPRRREGLLAVQSFAYPARLPLPSKRLLTKAAGKVVVQAREGTAAGLAGQILIVWSGLQRSGCLLVTQSLRLTPYHPGERQACRRRPRSQRCA